jgi:hypothetical protein
LFEEKRNNCNTSSKCYNYLITAISLVSYTLEIMIIPPVVLIIAAIGAINRLFEASTNEPIQKIEEALERPPPLPDWIRILVLAQTALTTLQAASRIRHLVREKSIGLVEGPLILPPVNDTSPLWELAHAFMHAVNLGLDPESFHDATYELDNAPGLEEGYSLSTYGTTFRADKRQDEIHRDEALELDKQIEHILAQAEQRPQRSFRSAIQEAFSGLLLPVVHSTRSLPKIPRILAKPRQLANDNEMDDDDDDTTHASEFFSNHWKATFQFSSHATPATNLKDLRVAHVKAYAPECFANLRRYYGIAECDYRKSMLESGPFVSFSSNSKGAARVGGVFFFTRDGAYMIKTIKQDEVRALLDMLPRYYQFMRGNGQRSLLTRFLGLYQVTIVQDDGSERSETLVVMNSVFPAEASKLLSERFDLKGSTIGRECSVQERETKGANAVLKDLDLAKEVQLVRSLQEPNSTHGYGICVGASSKAAIMTQLRKDVNLLVACGVIDYSLLVGVAKETGGLNVAERRAFERSEIVEERLKMMARRNSFGLFMMSVIAPVRSLFSPPLGMAQKTVALVKRSTAQHMFRPYYKGALCKVDTGPLSILQGKRAGVHATYYFGLIDFLQPFNSKKLVEYRVKGLLYEKGHYSCAPPEEYAERFLSFMDKHLV